MSKALATKVSTPLSENVWIRPKVSIFCVATIIFQHCLNPLGHGVHYSFTGCHWSYLPLLHDDITELVDVRDLALLHLPFEDAPQITFTLNFFRKAVVISEVCLGLLSCWNTSLRPSLRREGIMLCFSMSQYILAFMVPSMNCSSPVLAALMQPQTMTLPPPCLIVGKTHLSLYSSLVAATHAWHHLNQISLSWSHQTTGHGSSNPLMAVCLVILSGQHIYTVIQAVHSLHCSKVSFHKCCHMKR